MMPSRHRRDVLVLDTIDPDLETVVVSTVNYVGKILL